MKLVVSSVAHNSSRHLYTNDFRCACPPCPRIPLTQGLRKTKNPAQLRATHRFASTAKSDFIQQSAIHPQKQNARTVTRTSPLSSRILGFERYLPLLRATATLRPSLLRCLLGHGVNTGQRYLLTMAAARTPNAAYDGGGERHTRVLPVHTLNAQLTRGNVQKQWTNDVKQDSAEAKACIEAAELLRTSDIPVAFPTETVYGLGADATRSDAVRGIYRAKQRPSDNPLIVHVSSREQLERILRPHPPSSGNESSSIPRLYEPLIARFWPGPLTILLPNPPHSPLAPEVTSSLRTFGVRMPSSPLARLLIHLADRPLAAPSANASTKPSPTTAQHVYSDLRGRIDIILDGGPCGVGVESTVVDGLSQPPSILRPGGVGIEEIRACPGWEDVRVGYKDGAQQGKVAPRAPGMKYRHYSPKAKVVLFEAGPGAAAVSKRISSDIPQAGAEDWRIGVVRTKTWSKGLGMTARDDSSNGIVTNQTDHSSSSSTDLSNSIVHLQIVDDPRQKVDMLDLELGPDIHAIAKGLFSALRCLDERNVRVIYVEGISDANGDLAAAVMNRLRKAAEEEVK